MSPALGQHLVVVLNLNQYLAYVPIGWKIEQKKFERKENNLKENKEELIFFFGKKGKTKGRYTVTLVSGGTL